MVLAVGFWLMSFTKLNKFPQEFLLCINDYACAHAQSLRCVQLFATPWTVCSLSGSSGHGISRQEY